MNLSGLQKIFPGTKKKLIAYRMVNHEHVSSIDEIGFSMLYGWRYNPKNEFGVLYLSLSPSCCLKEKIKHSGGRHSLPTQILGRFEVNIQNMLNLTDEKVLSLLDTNYQNLTSPYDFNESQSIAREARQTGFEALLAPSPVGRDCVNFIVFKDKLIRKSYCELKSTKILKEF